MNSILATQHSNYTQHLEAILAVAATESMLKPEYEGLVGLELDVRHAVIAQRCLLESTRLFRQLISYCPIINSRGEVFVYLRKKGGAEKGLHDLYSIGIGGHIDGNMTEYNLDGGIDLHATIANETYREIHEETGLSRASYKVKPLKGKYILSNSNLVDSVHLGVPVFVYYDQEIFSPERNIIDAIGFVSLEKLKDYNLESWSQILAESEELKIACDLAKYKEAVDA